MVPNRVAKQCRERWRNHLDPAVSREDWTPQEEEILLQRYITFNGKWSEISKDMPGRPDNACKNQWNKLNGKGRYVIPAGKKKPPATGVAKRSHHKKTPGTVPRKRNRLLEGRADDLQKPLVLKVPQVGAGNTSKPRSGLETGTPGSLRYQQDRNFYSGDSEATQVGRSSDDYMQYREQDHDVQASFGEARARAGIRQESELTAYSTGTTTLEGFSFGQDIDAGHDEIPASGDGHVPPPFAWTDPQLPVEEPVSTDDPDGVVHEVMSSWDREAAGKSGQEDVEREDDTPQLDRQHSSSSGAGSGASLRLDVTTDFFANPEQGEYMHDILPSPRRLHSAEDRLKPDPVSDWVPPKYR